MRMRGDPMNEATVSGLEELRRLFQTDLKAVHFPSVDGEVLAKAASRVQLCTQEVERAEAQLAAARAALADAEEDELGRAHRALAYARVYAEDLPELHQRLQDLVLPALPAQQPTDETSSAPKRRGRPKSRAGGAPSLFAPTLAATLDTPELSPEDAFPHPAPRPARVAEEAVPF
jgi:hypothetical protein